MSKLIQVFLNSDLRCSHEGLSKIAKDNHIRVEELVPGEFVIFINQAMNRIKLYTAHQVVAYLKLSQGKVDLRTISLIPRAFLASGKISYDAALKEVLTQKLRA